MKRRSLLRRMLCALQMCETFETRSDKESLWAECRICGRKLDLITREELRRYATPARYGRPHDTD